MRRQPQKLTAVKTQSDATRLFQNAKYERVQKFNIYFPKLEGSTGEYRCVEECRGVAYAFNFHLVRETWWLSQVVGAAAFLDTAVTLPATVTATVTLTVTVTASLAIRASRRTTTTILTSNLLIPMNCGHPLECCVSSRLERGFCCMSKTNVAGICLIDKGLGCSFSQLLPGVLRSRSSRSRSRGRRRSGVEAFVMFSFPLCLSLSLCVLPL